MDKKQRKQGKLTQKGYQLWMGDRISSLLAFPFFFWQNSESGRGHWFGAKSANGTSRQISFRLITSLRKIGRVLGRISTSLGLEITNLNLKEALSCIFKYQHQAKNPLLVLRILLALVVCFLSVRVASHSSFSFAILNLTAGRNCDDLLGVAIFCRETLFTRIK